MLNSDASFSDCATIEARVVPYGPAVIAAAALVCASIKLSDCSSYDLIAHLIQRLYSFMDSFSLLVRPTHFGSCELCELIQNNRRTRRVVPSACMTLSDSQPHTLQPKSQKCKRRFRGRIHAQLIHDMIADVHQGQRCPEKESGCLIVSAAS